MTTLPHPFGRADDDLLTPEAYLELHRETGIGLRAVWTLPQRWAAFGDLSVAGVGKAST